MEIYSSHGSLVGVVVDKPYSFDDHPLNHDNQIKSGFYVAKIKGKNGLNEPRQLLVVK